MFNVYEQHGNHNVIMPQERSIENVRRLAEVSAELGQTAFFRAFKVVPTGERFETAFSVLNGKVVEHKDVTFPRAHF